MLRMLQKAALLITLLFTMQVASAEQVEVRGEYKIHYSAFGSTVLKPEIAAHYELVRSRYQGVLNIAVQKTTGQNNKAHTAVVEATVKNLLGQAQNVKFKEIREGDAIYYIGAFRFNNEEDLVFDVSVQPDAGVEPYTLTFQKKFYAD